MNDCIVKEKSAQPISTKNAELQRIVEKIENIAPMPQNKSDNLSTHERNALSALKSYDDIIIKKADKGGMLVVLDTSFYKNKMVLNDHLLQSNTYQRVPPNTDKKVMDELTQHLNKYEKCLYPAEFKYILNKKWKSSNIYVTPKVHKNKSIIDACSTSNTDFIQMTVPQDLKGRPIIAGPESPTQRLSELVEKILSPLVPRLRSFVQDDIDFVRKLPRSTTFECEIYSVDIVSLYTNIPHELGIEAVGYYIDNNPDLIPERFSKEFIIQSLLFVLRNNNFIFDGKLYHQITGTAMGTKLAPPYANLSVGYLEETKLYPSLPLHFEPDICDIIIQMFLRYIDDGFVMWPFGEHFDTFLHLLNSMNSSLKYTVEKSKHSTEDDKDIQNLPFLCVLVIVKDRKHFSTDIFYKETNSHFYLDYNSHHPQHIKNNLPYSLARKIVAFVSDEDKLNSRLREMKTWLLQCNYPAKTINKGIHNAKKHGPAPPPKNMDKTLIFTSTFVSNLTHDNTIHQINELLKNTKSAKLNEIFDGCRAMIAYKQPNNIQRLLTKAAFSSNNTNSIKNGLFRCGRDICKLCKLYIQECTSFICSNGFRWEIRSHIDCHSRNVLYYLKCRWCDNPVTAYSGKTNIIRDRMNGHISGCRLGTTTDIFDNHVYECRRKHGAAGEIEPFFYIYAFFTVKNTESLETYEKDLHRKGYDTMNRPK